MKKTKKLKRKIWFISSIVLVSYTVALILNPTSVMTLLPIIIPAGVLTFGLPAYAIIKNTKDSIEKIPTKTSVLNEDNNAIKTKNKKEKFNNENNEQLNIISEIQIEQNKSDKPKIKSKGTIN